jgi:hypothetical protein
VALQATTRIKERRCTAFKERMRKFHRFYKSFHSLSYDDNQAAFNERKRLNITPKKRRRGVGGGKSRNASSVKAGKKAVAKLAKQISALTSRVNDVEKKRLPTMTRIGSGDL